MPDGRALTRTRSLPRNKAAVEVEKVVFAEWPQESIKSDKKRPASARDMESVSFRERERVDSPFMSVPRPNRESTSHDSISHIHHSPKAELSTSRGTSKLKKMIQTTSIKDFRLFKDRRRKSETESIEAFPRELGRSTSLGMAKIGPNNRVQHLQRTKRKREAPPIEAAPPPRSHLSQ